VNVFITVKNLKKIALLLMLQIFGRYSDAIAMKDQFSNADQFTKLVEHFVSVMRNSEQLEKFSVEDAQKVITFCTNIQHEIVTSNQNIRTKIKALDDQASACKIIHLKDVKTKKLNSFLCPSTSEEIFVDLLDDTVSQVGSIDSKLSFGSWRSIILTDSSKETTPKPIVQNSIQGSSKRSVPFEITIPTGLEDKRPSPATVTVNYSPSNLSLSETRSGRRSNIPADCVEYFQSLQKRRRVENLVE